jgi:hypothetical protein
LLGVRQFFIRTVAKVCAFMRENARKANDSVKVARICQRVAVQRGPARDVDGRLCAPTHAKERPGFSKNAHGRWTYIDDDDFRRLNGRPVQKVERRLDRLRVHDLSSRTSNDRLDQ